MLFAHDTSAALVIAADLVNTHVRGTEALPDAAALDVFRDEHGLTGSSPSTRAELDAVLALRPQLRAAWNASTAQELASTANKLLRGADARPWLTNHDGLSWHLHVTEPGARIDQRIAAQAGWAFADLVRLQETTRLRTCDAEDCDAVFIDLSRNRSRRYCDTGNCGNRQHVAAYRARKAAKQTRLASLQPLDFHIRPYRARG